MEIWSFVLEADAQTKRHCCINLRLVAYPSDGPEVVSLSGRFRRRGRREGVRGLLPVKDCVAGGTDTDPVVAGHGKARFVASGEAYRARLGIGG
jgi:hypothetical protein